MGLHKAVDFRVKNEFSTFVGVLFRFFLLLGFFDLEHMRFRSES